MDVNGVITVVTVTGGLAVVWGDMRSKVSSIGKWIKGHQLEATRRDDKIAEIRIDIATTKQWQYDIKEALKEINGKLDRVK